MEMLIDILQITIPTVVVMLTAYLIIRKFFENARHEREEDFKRKNLEQLLPVRLQAYERLVLYLERITPGSLVMRVHKPGISAKVMRQELLRIVREEFDHNLTQQVYVSINAWEVTKSAKEEVIKIINIAGQNVDATADGLTLYKQMVDLESRLEKLPTAVAIDYLKKEVAKKFY